MQTNNTDSNMLESANLDPEVLEKLKGDAIGNTVYSESFVTKLLMHLDNVEWTEEYEKELETLWDMTIDKDVCEFLNKLNYTSIFVSVLNKYPENGRLVEITLGILGNMLCVDDNNQFVIPENNLNFIINTLKHPNDDVGVQQQFFRFLRCLKTTHQTTQIFNNRDIYNSIIFVLNNCLNNDVICETLHLFSLYARTNCVDISDADEIFTSVLVASNFLLSQSDDLTEECFGKIQYSFVIFANTVSLFTANEGLNNFIGSLSSLTDLHRLCGKTIKFFSESMNWLSDLRIMQNIFDSLYKLCASKIYSYNKEDFANMLLTVVEIEANDELENFWFLLYPISSWITVIDVEQLLNDMKNNNIFEKSLKYLEQNLEDENIKLRCRELLSINDRNSLNK